MRVLSHSLQSLASLVFNVKTLLNPARLSYKLNVLSFDSLHFTNIIWWLISLYMTTTTNDVRFMMQKNLLRGNWNAHIESTATCYYIPRQVTSLSFHYVTTIFSCTFFLKSSNISEKGCKISHIRICTKWHIFSRNGWLYSSFFLLLGISISNRKST